MNNIETTGQNIYDETVADLRAKIEANFGSVLAFCKANDIDHANLYKIFNRTNGQEMSIGMFARICAGLGDPIASGITNSNLSLKQYLQIDNNAVFRCILNLTFKTEKQ
jgi:hypothetical protein